MRLSVTLAWYLQLFSLGRNTPNNKFLHVTNKENKKSVRDCSPSFMNLDQLIFTWKGRHLVLALFASYNSMELWNFNWPCKRIKKRRSSQDLVLINCFSLWVCMPYILYLLISVVSFRSNRSQTRSSPSEVFLRKDVLKICSKFTGEHLYQSVISIKLQSNFV